MAALIGKRMLKSVAAAAQLGRIRSANVPGAVNILAYHRVVNKIDQAERTAFHGLVISTTTFRKHCELLKENFNVVSLERAYSHLIGKDPSDRPLAVITFDDGYRDFFEEAFPVLSSLDLTATVFLPSGFIGKNIPLDHDRLFWLLKQSDEKGINITPALTRAGVPPGIVRRFDGNGRAAMTELLVFLPVSVRGIAISELEKTLNRPEQYPNEYQLLSWAQVREMAKAGIDFGAHTSDHVVLTRENQDEATRQIVASKAELEAQLGRPVLAFAYPNGEYTPAIQDAVNEAGFRLAVTTRRHVNRPGCDRYALGRFSLCEESTRGIAGRYSEKIGALRLGI